MHNGSVSFLVLYIRSFLITKSMSVKIAESSLNFFFFVFHSFFQNFQNFFYFFSKCIFEVFFYQFLTKFGWHLHQNDNICVHLIWFWIIRVYFQTVFFYLMFLLVICWMRLKWCWIFLIDDEHSGETGINMLKFWSISNSIYQCSWYWV